MKKGNGIAHRIIHGQRSFGQKAADGLAKWAGSWAFIIGFFGFLILWMAANVYGWINQWDPYPFILLNLVLSCLAAIQAPVILMSQNRQSQKDRSKANYDYQINRNSEKGIEAIRTQLNSLERMLFKKR
tara:strand:- start:298 stop:684 length:387 start_codon:yes stop_codon:yes gene_type:complete